MNRIGLNNLIRNGLVFRNTVTKNTVQCYKPRINNFHTNIIKRNLHNKNNLNNNNNITDFTKIVNKIKFIPNSTVNFIVKNYDDGTILCTVLGSGYIISLTIQEYDNLFLFLIFSLGGTSLMYLFSHAWPLIIPLSGIKITYDTYNKYFAKEKK